MREDDPTQADPNLRLARSLCEQAAQHNQQAEFSTARSLYMQALVVLEPVVGSSHPDTARCLNGLGQVLMRQGDYDQARLLVERALSIRRRVLGPKHADTAESLHTLGELESDQGDFGTGLSLVEQAFSLRRQALGEAHPDTLESRTILALMLFHEGDPARAEELLLEARSLCQKNHGENHLSTARVLNALGRIWAADKTMRSRARSMYQRALVISEHLLGQTHPFTALVLNNLAALLADMRDYAAALPLLERSLAVHEWIYGPASWRTSFVLVNLADVHSQQEGAARSLLERTRLVRDLLERALIIRERAWGARHPETVACLRKLVAALGKLQQQGDEQALIDGPVLFPCLVAFERAAGSQQPAYRQMPGSSQDPDKAAQQLHRWVTTREAERTRAPVSAADQELLQAARDLVQQADDKDEQGDATAAIGLLQEALGLQEQVLGQRHLDHVKILQKLARVQARAGRYGAVRPLTQRIVDIHLHVLGLEHPMTGIALTELMTQAAFELGPAAALPLQEQILQSMEGALGPEDRLVKLARQAVRNFRELLGETAVAGSESGLVEQPRPLSERRENAVTGVRWSEQDPLAGLDDIRWHDLRHAYGPASEVPNLLRMLTSEDEEVRHSAWEDLYSCLCHQGDIYQATVQAVPFLLRLLDAPSLPGKYDLLVFLEAVASGTPWLTEDHPWMEETLASEGRDFQAEIEEAQLDAEAARAAVRDGLGTYLDCLQDSSAPVRQRAFALLCAFPECGDDVLPTLLNTLEGEPYPTARAHMVHHLGLFLASSPASADRAAGVDLFIHSLRPVEDRRLRFAAAVALANLEGDSVPPEAITILEEAVVEPRGLRPSSSGRSDEPAYLLELAVESACQALSCLSVEHRIPILVRLLERIAMPAHAHRVAVLLLDSTFLGRGRTLLFSGTPGATDEVVYYTSGPPTAAGATDERIYPKAGQPQDPTGLTPIQKQVLEAVLECQPLWRIRSNLLELYGLSGTI